MAGEDEENRTKLVQFKAPRDRVDEWDDFVENEPRFDDRSDLIRKSVERTISTDTDEQDTQNGIGRQEALEQFERIESLLNDLDREVKLVQQDVVNEDTMDDIVGQRTYQATLRALQNKDIVEEEGDDDS
jgi:Arc/MetJ-type ribon-helix-helix transcriptional regulator